MALVEEKHATQVMAEMGWTEVPKPTTAVPFEGFESAEMVPMDEAHDLMQPWHALQLALVAEQRAERFFAHLASIADNDAVRKAALELQQEEREHVEVIEAWLKRTPRPEANWANDPDPPYHHSSRIRRLCIWPCLTKTGRSAGPGLLLSLQMEPAVARGRADEQCSSERNNGGRVLLKPEGRLAGRPTRALHAHRGCNRQVRTCRRATRKLASIKTASVSAIECLLTAAEIDAATAQFQPRPGIRSLRVVSLKRSIANAVVVMAAAPAQAWTMPKIM